MQKKVLNLAIEHHHRMEEESGVESSMTDGSTALKQYLGKVLTELKHTTNDPLK
jgi:hypothetical protein